MEEEGEKDGGLGASPQKMVLMATPYRTSGNTFLQHGMTIAIIIDLCA